jgi:predicted RNA-binding Zn-ribbon protein involved in translation (DUF1610 family)
MALLAVVRPEDADRECTFCGEPYHLRCAHCHRPGVPYEYKGQVYDGLIAYKGEKLCRSCEETISAIEGVNFIVVDHGQEFLHNTVRDADLVTPIAAEYRYPDYRRPRRRRS